MDGLHSLAYPASKLAAITAEEAIRLIARSVAPAADDADIPTIR